jgi:uncharacterized protein CbrC (UPF0167 family)
VYAEDDYENNICPWCIADGSAHMKLDAEFNDPEGIPGWRFAHAPRVSPAVIEEICWRTPGFAGWQAEQWFTCCDDGAAFLGAAGYNDLLKRWPEAVQQLKTSAGLDGDEWESLLNSLTTHGSPTAYVFRCLHCDKYGAYRDFD